MGDNPKKAPPVPASYGRMLMQRAARHGLTREAFARKAGMSDQTAWRVETGNRDSSVKAAYKLREVLIGLGEDVPPVPVGVENWDEVPPVTTPRAGANTVDAEAEAIRRNIIQAREAMHYNLHDVADYTGIPLEKLRAYELGTEEISGLHLKALAKLYGRSMNDVTEPDMPLPEPSSRRVIHMRTDPGALEMLSPAQRELLERLMREAAELNEAARARMDAERERQAKRSPKKGQ